MKMITRLFKSLFVSLMMAIVLGLALWNTNKVSVTKGFVFGPPIAQQIMSEDGTYTVKRWGFPATYKETQFFHATNGNYQTSYESKPFNTLLAIVNVVFWMSLLVSILSPVTIFFRPKKHDKKASQKLNEVVVEKKPTPEAK